MKTLSFRLRIALLSCALTGGMLVALGVLFWQLTDRMDLARVDRELRNLGNPQLDRVNGPSHWERFEDALKVVAGSGRPMPYLLWVHQEGREIYRSEAWPAALDPGRLPLPTTYPPEYHLSPNDPPPPMPRREPISPENPALPLKEPRFLTVTAGGHRWRIGVLGSPYTTLALGADLGQLTAGTTQLRHAYLIALPVVLLLVGGGSWLLSGRALRPLTVLIETLERITARGLDRRIPELSRDQELSRLVTVFNQMMDRLETSFHQATRFSADAAHELKTPLTILQGELELGLHAAEPGSEQQRLFGRLIEELARMRSITEKLLLLAQADAGTLPLHLQEVVLSEILQEAVEDLGVLAPGVTVVAEVDPEVRVAGDPHLLAQLVQNLTTNAARYNTATGRIALSLAAAPDQVVLRVTNTGPEIPRADQGRLFDRFYRGEVSRSREHGGVGLGLSLSREIARAHGGELTLEASEQGATTFKLVLPRG